MRAVCGDGVMTPFAGEVCDDGNAQSGDGCDANCTLTACGNGVVTAGEQCDDGPIGSATCDPDCTQAVCGDGVLNRRTFEECDDGNVVPLDGCSADCRLQEPCAATPEPFCHVAAKTTFDERAFRGAASG
jgi:cysteine-rich repeat protein